MSGDDRDTGPRDAGSHRVRAADASSRRTTQRLLGAIALVGALAVLPVDGPSVGAQPRILARSSPAPIVAPSNVVGTTSLPVSFVPNQGQVSSAVRYQAVVGDAAVFATDDGLTVVRSTVVDDAVDLDTGAEVAPPEVRRLRFDGVAPGVRIIPGAKLSGVASFLQGNDPHRWVTGVPTYAGITYRDLYHGVDLVVDGAGGDVAIRFATAPGVDPGVIRWRYLDERGRPVAFPTWADADGASAGDPVRDAVDVLVDSTGSRAAATARPGALSRAARTHRSAGTPTLVYSTFLGGRFNDMVRGLAVDGEGFAYVAGTTTSLDFPTALPFQPAIGNSGSLQDAFVAKLDPTGTHLVYSTFIGGNRQDEAFALAIDRVGRAYITGYTTSPDFPTVKAVQPALHLAEGIFSGDTFIAKLNPDGSGLEFSTFLGGTARDVGKGIAVDDAGYVYTTGWTGSNFPAFKAIHPLNRGVRDAFVAKLTPTGDKVLYSTHLGGSTADDAKGIAVDAAGNAYIVGTTHSLNFEVVAPYQRVISGATDAFVAKINADGSAFGYATYLGGSGDDIGIGIAVSPSGEAYVLGQTDSPNFPRQTPLQNARSGPNDLFVTRFTPAGDALLFSTYLGGSAREGDCVQAENFRDLATPTPDGRNIRYLEGSKFTDGPVGAIALDAAGRIHVASCTSSGNLPVVNPLQNQRIGDYSLMLQVLEPHAGGLVFGTYLGGRGMNVARALAIGSDGGIYVAGQTDAPDFPTAPSAGPFRGTRSGTDDAFVLKIGDAVPVAPTWTPPVPSATIGPTDTPTPDVTVTPSVPATDTPTVEPTPTTGPTTPVPPTATATEVPATPTPDSAPIYLPDARANR